MDKRKDILWRVYLVYFMVCLFGLTILYKAFRIQVFEGEQWIAKAKMLTTDFIPIDAVRGNIFASDGSLLAASVPVYEVRMDINTEVLTDKIFYGKIDSLAFCLSSLLNNKSEKQYRRELITARKEGQRYHLIHNKVSYNQLKAMRKFPVFRLGKYKGGFIYVQKNKRQKPFQLLAARTIGYEREGIRPVGLEGAYDHYLKGIGGKRLMQRIAGGVWKPINDINEIEPEDGSDIITTLDINIQDVAENALLKELIKNDADHGCVVLMEVATGEIRAIANLKRSEAGVFYEGYNYAVGESTEPGSTFKLPALMVALEDEYVDLNDSVDTEKGTMQYYDQTMRDSHLGGYGKISVRDAFEKSSNVGISKIITQHYSDDPQQFIDRLYNMNLNDKLGLDIAGEGAPMIKKPTDKDWSGITLPWMSVGYEVRQTPLQILTFYNAVANDGKMVKPIFVREIIQRGKTIKRYKPEMINSSICSRETIKKVREILEGVIENGTAQNLKGASYKIGGKTGTAQIANEKYGYKADGKYSYQASFVGYFPAENPKYSCIVVVNSPSKNVYYANQVAGPIFKEIADKIYATRLEIHPEISENNIDPPYTKYGHRGDIKNILKTLNIPYKSKSDESRWVVTNIKGAVINLSIRNIEDETQRGIIPNLYGMAAQDAVYLLENAGVKVKLVGTGMIVNQSIQAGTKIQKGSEIILDLG